MNIHTILLAAWVTIFAPIALAEPPTVTPFRARPEDIVRGIRSYHVFFCLNGIAQSLPSIQRPNEKGQMIDYDVKGDAQNCFLFDEHLSAEEGWRVVCYRLKIDDHTRVIKMYYNPSDSTFASGIDSRDPGDTILGDLLGPKLNKNLEKKYESALCQNLSS